MSEMIWRDRFTGTRYECGEAWQSWVKLGLTKDLANRISNCKTHEEAANKVGRFWKISYYERLFPLRFGRKIADGMFEYHLLWERVENENASCQKNGATQTPEVEKTPAVFSREKIKLKCYADQDKYRLRTGLLDGDRLPPILPDFDEEMAKKGWLLADRLLVETALLNLLLAQKPEVSDKARHAARLAALSYPFRDELLNKSETLDLSSDKLANLARLLTDPLVESISLILAGKDAKLPYSHKSLLESVQAVRDKTLRKQDKVRLVMVAAQRVKKYVFDTPGLNEIRGGSTLLEQITGDLRKAVEKEIGPEVVLRAAGSTLVFVAPAIGECDIWPERLRRTFWMRTGTAFTAAAAVDVTAQSLLNEYGEAIGKLYRALDIDRAQAKQPIFVTLPFETRCELCQMRAAEGWDAVPGTGEPRPLCRVCKSKRKVGQKGRYVQVNKILGTLGYNGNPAPLGVKLPEKSDEKGSEESHWVADDLESLIARGVRRSLLGVVYGDGNNFGAVAIKLDDLALGLQWTARLEHTTTAAAALALGQATQQGAKLRGWQPDNDPLLDKIPFQVLAVGGDDISLFAWAPVAVHFAAQFTALTDLELEAVGKPEERLSADPLTFSLGVLVTDQNTPVVKSVEFTESQLLKWAKKAAKSGDLLPYGNIAMLYAPTAESVPADLKHYRDEMYILGGGINLKLCTTLRPYSAQELQMLLKVAAYLLKKGNLGRFQRLVGAFYGARQSVMVGLLHYAYQQGRTSSQTWINELEQELMSVGNLKVEQAHQALLVKYPVEKGRQPFGLAPEKDKQQPNEKAPWFSPLWDLLELAKLMS